MLYPHDARSQNDVELFDLFQLETPRLRVCEAFSPDTGSLSENAVRSIAVRQQPMLLNATQARGGEEREDLRPAWRLVPRVA